GRRSPPSISLLAASAAWRTATRTARWWTRWRISGAWLASSRAGAPPSTGDPNTQKTSVARSQSTSHTRSGRASCRSTSTTSPRCPEVMAPHFTGAAGLVLDYAPTDHSSFAVDLSFVPIIQAIELEYAAARVSGRIRLANFTARQMVTSNDPNCFTDEGDYVEYGFCSCY